jgi:hypothetical protein
MTLEALKTLMESGEFHHATYRCMNSLWEGLWIYRRCETGFRGFEPAGCFYKASPDLDAAYAVVAGTGCGCSSQLGQYLRRGTA